MVVRELQSAVSQPGLNWVGTYVGNDYQWLASVIEPMHGSIIWDFSSGQMTWETLCGELKSASRDHNKVGVISSWSRMAEEAARFGISVCNTCLTIALTEDLYV